MCLSVIDVRVQNLVRVISRRFWNVGQLHLLVVREERLRLLLFGLLFLIRGCDGSKLGIPLSLLQCRLSLGLKSLSHSLLLSDFNLLHHCLHHVKLVLDLEIQVAVGLHMPKGYVIRFAVRVYI